MCIRKKETVSYLHNVYDLDFMYQKNGNCMNPTMRVCSEDIANKYKISCFLISIGKIPDILLYLLSFTMFLFMFWTFHLKIFIWGWDVVVFKPHD